FDSNEEEVVPKVDGVSLVDGVFDGAFGGDGEEDFVMGEGVVVSSSSLVRSTKSCLGGIMVSLIFLERLEEEACVDAMKVEEKHSDMYDATPPKYQPVSPFEFDSHQQLVLSGFYTLSPFVIRFLNAEGVYKFRRHAELLLFSIVNDPYGDIDSQAFMVSSAASKDELVVLGLGRMFYQFTHGYNPLYGCSIYNLDKVDLNRVLYTAKVNRVYRLRITSPILRHAFS
ncbi:hypothetical protein Tco_0920959, partial [Tanacetum coccineum]